MKNKSTIALIIISLICSFFYITRQNNDNEQNFYIEATKIKDDEYEKISTHKENVEHNITKENVSESSSVDNKNLDNKIESHTINEKNELININKADKKTLESLPGIGDVISNNIIEYRENVSLFYKIEDIKNVKQIGEKKYEKIKYLITVN